MFDIGGGELLLILVAILLLFGPKKIPEMAQMLGKGMQQLKKAQSQLQEELKNIEKEVDKQVNITPEIRQALNIEPHYKPVSRQIEELDLSAPKENKYIEEKSLEKKDPSHI